jgi:hypothetical protein
MASDGESASPSRRSSRNRAPVNYSHNVIKIIEHVEPETRKRRRAPRKLHTAVTRGRPRIKKDENDDDHQEGARDSEEDTDSMGEPPVKKQKATKKGQVTKKGRGPESIRTCEFCNKVCITKTGLKYHIGK